MKVDYARYGVGEAMLGWVNARATLEGRTFRGRFNPDVWLMDLAQSIHHRLRRSPSSYSSRVSTCSAIRPGVPVNAETSGSP